MTLPTITQSGAPRPVHDDPLAQAGLCSVCPKLCRPACPVQAATGRESAAPWRISDAVVRGLSSGWTAELAEQVAQCTGCGACGEPCLPGTNLPEESRAARAAAADAGALLPAAVTLRGRVAATGSPRSSRRPAVGPPGAPTVLLAGCGVPREVEEAALALFAAAGEDVRTVDACCGAVAEDLGLAPEAASLRASLDAAVAGADVVAVSPSCARALGARTAVEWLASRLDRLTFSPLGGAVAWHAPCTLTRVLGVVEPPLRALRALGAEVREPAATGAATRCSGAGAAYPLVDPAGAAAVADVRRAELAALDAPVVTACPSAARALGGTELLVLAASRLARR